jgi:hypothetical protein
MALSPVDLTVTPRDPEQAQPQQWSIEEGDKARKMRSAIFNGERSPV